MTLIAPIVALLCAFSSPKTIRMAGKTIVGTRDLAALDEKTIETLTQEIAAFGPEPEVTR